MKFSVLCSGGDSPGMNCAIRAIVRTAIFHQHQIVGIKRGYSGLLRGEMQEMSLSSVGNILQRGGTILQTSRCPEWHKTEFRKKAAEILRSENIDGLIVIGGDGSFNGAMSFYQETNFPVIGVPGTIDNDISGTDYTIGFDTAVQTAIEAVDRIRDTAHSHARTFLVEVMGRNSAAIALKVGVCTGAENVLLPHDQIPLEKIVSDINRGMARGKESSIIIVAEGPVSGRSYELQTLLKKYNLDAHVCILGHIQRGGSPTLNDRFIASQMGSLATEALIAGHAAKAVVQQNGKIILEELANCLKKNDNSFSEFRDLAHKLSI